MEISVISFSEKGNMLAEEVFRDWEPGTVTICCKHAGGGPENLKVWAKEQFAAKRALVFIGACGIAVRTIAPFIGDKLTDSPVLCMDEAGQFVIPLLSGHVGGANELAGLIAGKTGAVPVITTATDVNGTFAVDLFAKKNHLTIQNKEGIGKISAKVLKKEMVDIVISPDLTQLSHGILRLKPKEYIIGIGCRRGKAYQSLAAFIEKWLDVLQLDRSDVLMLASIDLKKEEPGLVRWAGSNRIPFQTYTAEELQAVPGEFPASEFVRKCTGADNVCERAAMRAAGPDGEVVLSKQAEDGMTIAVVRKKWELDTENQEGIIIDEA